MTHERERPAERAGDAEPPGGGAAVSQDGSHGGSLEAVFAELVRRAASLGFQSFFLTEKALRGAFSDAVPDDWVEYASRQGDELRAELIDRMAREFGEWLRTLDVGAVLGDMLRESDVSVRLELSARPKSADHGGSIPRGRG